MLVVKKSKGKFVAFGIFFVLLVFFINTGFQAYAQIKEQKKHEIVEEDSFQRPEPSRPIQPEIPTTNRYQEDKVFLEYADSLYKRKINRFDTIERQILKGNVKFRQAGMWMFCDSAYYYPEENSLDAFSNVRMEQGDTLFVYADKLFYNGDLHLAKLQNGPTREKVTLINKDVTLTTDSLDYNLEIDLGWYVKWGTIDDKVNTLTSLYGEYSPKTKRAEFFTDVELVNQKDGFTMYTDTLYYSTENHIANIESPTEIRSANDTIFTNLATYYTDTGNADLLSRSLIVHKDSTGNVTTLEGDSIVYDNATRISRAYMFRDPFKHSNPMVITDTAQKTTLIGGFGIYNDSTKEALATIYPLLMEYSQGDTLFLRADTILTFMVTEMIYKPKRKTKSGFPEFNEEIITMKDSLTGKLWIDTAFFKVRVPYVDKPIEMLWSAAPPLVYEDTLDSDSILIADSLIIIPDLILPDSIPFKDDTQFLESLSLTDELNETDTTIVSVDKLELVSADAIIEEKIIKEIPEEPKDDGMHPLITESEIDFIPLDSIPYKEIWDVVILSDTVLNIGDSIVENMKEDMDSIPYQFHVILAYNRGRFFKQDMQGVADSMVFVEKDSILYLFKKPIVWSEERQVTGNRIDVHFNDSTADWAYLPDFGLMSEHVEEDFYNQIFGKEITAYFENQGLRRMSVSGNVETIFLPQEEDSTFNRMVNAESSYMEVYLDSNRLDWLKMWPEVSGTVTPIFLVKRTQMYLQKFKWWGFLRPQREWYGDRMHWADDLGEVPDELDQYFRSPSDFGEPKPFEGSSVIIPPSSFSMWMDMPRIEEPFDSVSEILLLEPELDSISSNAILKIDKEETIQDILQSEEEEDKEADEIEQQSIEIDDAVVKEESESDIQEQESDVQDSEIDTQEEEVIDNE